jgi:succinoglycan biosynthesis protein ExoM
LDEYKSGLGKDAAPVGSARCGTPTDCAAGVSADRLEQLTICICTFRRPGLLRRLLQALAAQRPVPGLCVSVVVVDNDESRSAEAVVEQHGENALDVRYLWEPRRNIALARNAAVRSARSALIAFLDDDEWPSPDWLAHLYHVLVTLPCDGVLGPVVPEYPPGAPRWLRRSAVFRRRRLATGSTVTLRDARTGNVLLRRAGSAEDDEWFDGAYGRTGGEDSDFFRRQFANGRVFVWCDEAVVFETVGPERWSRAFHVAREWRSGVVGAFILRRQNIRCAGAVVRETASLGLGVFLALPAALLPAHISLRIWQRLAYSIGFLGALSGIFAPRERP